MKLKRLVIASITVMLMSVFLTGTAASAAEAYKIKVTYRQTEARTMLNMINEFRTGADAWQWDSNGNRIEIKDNANLVYDYNLENIAMLRAAELVAAYSHTRPNGDRCFTAYTGSYGRSAENIAIGTSNLTADAVFKLWREDDEDYSGQGHRRNMLHGDLGAVGIAHVYYNGCHYWVQEFGDVANVTNATAANDSETEVEISVDPSNITEKTITAQETNISLAVGEKKDIPKAVIKFRTKETWSYAPAAEAEIGDTITWRSSNTEVLKVDGSSMTGLKDGIAVLSADYLGQKLTMSVTVGKADGTDLKNAVVTLTPAAFVYSGKENKPSVTVAIGEKSLTAGKDFTVTYTNNINAGSAKVTIKGMGEYTGSVDKAFEITQADISKLKGVVSQTKKADGTYDKPTLSLYYNDVLLKHGSDYISEIKADTDGKTVIMYGYGAGNFKGTYVSAVYTLLDDEKPGNTDEDKLSLKLGKKKYTFKYSVKARKFKLSVKAEGGKPVYKSNKAKVKVNKNGKVTIAKKFRGKAKISVILKGQNGNKITKKVSIVVK